MREWARVITRELRWFVHNTVIHLIAGILWLCQLNRAGDWLHDLVDIRSDD